MIITIANQKGGSGKSTIAINLAIKLLEAGNVLLMDTDSQRNIESFTNTREAREDVSSLKHFTLSNRTGDITQSLKQSLEIYQNIVIDTGGIDSIESRKAMLYADYLIIPTIPSPLDFDVLITMLNRAKEIKEINEKLNILLVINKVSPNPFLAKEIADLNEAINTIQETNQVFKILDTILYNSISYKRSIGDGLSILEYTDTKAKKEFENFFSQIWEKEQEHNLIA